VEMQQHEHAQRAVGEHEAPVGARHDGVVADVEHVVAFLAAGVAVRPATARLFRSVRTVDGHSPSRCRTRPGS
jgi:hypothetical protein